MANASTKKTAQSNATLLRTLLVAPFVAALLHLPLRWFIRSRAFVSWPSFIFVVLVAGQVFGWRFLQLNANVRRDARGMMKSAGVDLSTAGGLVEVIQDFIYLSSGLNLLAPIISFKLYWLLVAVPALGGYKLWIFAKPFIAQQTANAQNRATAAIDGVNGNGAGAAAESSSKRAEKMKKKQEKLERAQTGGRGARR